MDINDKITATYNALKRRTEKEYSFLDEYQKQHVELVNNGAFDTFKIYFSEELEALGLDTTLSYTLEKEIK